MDHKYSDYGIRAPFARLQHRRGALLAALSLSGSLLLGAAPRAAQAQDEAPRCGQPYDPSASYPSLPEREGAADISGEAGVVVYMHEARALVELEGCIYRVDRPLLVDFDGLDFFTLLVELPDHSAGAEVYVSEDGEWMETLTLSSSFSYVIEPGGGELGLELATPGLTAPTRPIIVAKPTTGNPEPK